MELKLVIKKKDGHCDDDCNFLHEYGLGAGATCLLFNHTLSAKMEYGDIDYWRSCGDCIIACNKCERVEANKNA